MKPLWGDLNARVAGLRTRLLSPAQLALLARTPDLPALATALSRSGFPLEESAVSPAALELAVRRHLAVHIEILGEWSGADRAAVLSVIFEDEDRRSLRAILRGIGERAPPEQRLAGLLPTRALPERALRELARQPSAASVAALLSTWRHPFATALATPRLPAVPDMLDIDVRLNRAFAARAVAGARTAGHRGVLSWYVAQMIDVENAYAAMALAGAVTERLADVFLPGGEAISRSVFDAAVRAGSQAAAAQRVADAFAGSLLARAFAPDAEFREVERRVLDAQVMMLRIRARRDPLSAAPVLAHALQVRAQSLDLRALIWSIALGVPAPWLPSHAATP
jgi:vacuolar-type H+-ATPase subunit C/Vma6